MGTNITGIGNANAIGFKSRVTGGIYFPPELKDALVGVWSAYGKSNDSTDRNIIKNKIKNRGGDFVISNAAFKLNSGFGKYEEDFTSWRIYPNIKVTDNVITTNGNFNSTWFIYKHSSESKINEMNIKVSGIPKGGKILYLYISDETANLPIVYTIPKDGIYHLPESKINNNRVSVGFTVESRYDWNNIRIEQIPSFQGAFVTDGIDDLITSTKTVQEMLGGSNEMTIISLIGVLSGDSENKAFINTIYPDASSFIRNTALNADNGKLGCFGYSVSNINNYIPNSVVINNILGDKNDYIVQGGGTSIIEGKLSVVGRHYNNGSFSWQCQAAWYWTIIANKVLTTDEINQVIAYFNLDRTLKPDILCNTIKQGITNENHAEFGDKLIDFSGNGRDIQLNNLAWDGDSGIGKYNYPNWKVTATIANTYSTIVNYPTVNGTYSINVNGVSELMQSIGLHLEIKYTTSTGIIYNDIKQDGVYSYILPDGATDLTLRFGGIPGIVNEPCNITITQIPSHAGGLCLDGINDFGKVTGMPIYKDYTVIADYERFYLEPITGGRASILSKSSKVGDGSFIFNLEDQDGGKACYTFGEANGNISDDITRIIRYQSKYYNTKTLSIGTAEDNDFMVLGKVREVDSRYFCGAIYSLMSFPYSMSEFLIERQLKKHKLGTLYPDMVEFRPVIKTNTEWEYLEIYQGDNRLYNLSEHDDKTGIYLEENSSIEIYVKPYTGQKVSKIVYNGTSYIDLENNGYGYYYITVPVTKSPQKIGITIEQDENYVQWNPVVESNVAYKSIRYYKLGDSGSGWIRINIGDYISIGRMIMITIDTANTVDELVSVVSSQLTGIGINSSNGTYNITGTLTSESLQNINITIDEYIRYEDIVQPYPALLRFKDENGNEVSWGGKFKVGSTITRIGSVADSNLLPNIYNIFGLLLNGNQVTSSKVIVEKTMVFKAKSAYIFDNNEPKCILSPSRLRIPNSSYKLLGYIPDISGHGNNGVIHNSAYAEGSGVNEDGSYQLDGVDDFVTIPTIVGGKQVLMKVNWQNKTGLLYDQRKNGSSIDAFAILNVNSNNSIAYNSRNTDGETYIDGILNKNIVCPQLYKITHSITIINQLANKEEIISPTIGSDTTHKVYFSQMALYDFMLFDGISTDDKIKELNEYVGIEGNTE